MNIDEKIAEYKADIEKCERVCAVTAIGSIRDAALRKAEDCKQIVEWLEELKQLREQNKWIPISKETPKKQGYYITSTIYNEVYCDYWNGDNFDRTEAVLAWQELPEPYRAESEVEE